MLRFVPVLIGWLFTSLAVGQVVVVDSLPETGFPLATPWAFHAGDNPDWSRPNLPDSAWQTLDPRQLVADLLPRLPARIGWLRLQVTVPAAEQNLPVVLRWRQTAATELFVNGKLMRRTGTFPDGERPTEATNPYRSYSVAITPDSAGRLVLAVRLAVQPNGLQLGQYTPLNSRLLDARLLRGTMPDGTSYLLSWQPIAAAFTAGIFFLLFLLHTLFRIYTPADRTNGAMAVACFSFGIAFLAIVEILSLVENQPAYAAWSLWGTLAYPVGYLALLRATYAIFNKKPGWICWLVVGLVGLCAVMPFVRRDTEHLWIEFGPALLVTAECSRVMLKARRHWGGEFITAGMVSALVLFSIYCIHSVDALTPLRPVSLSSYQLTIMYYLAVLCIPVSISLYVARSFIFTQRRMTGQLLEVQRLSKQSFEQEQERQTMLARQKETLERQVAERTGQLQESLDELRTTQNQLVQKEKMASLGELTAGIAHEIQNPLNFVTNFSEVSVDLVSELLEERDRTPRDPALEAELLADLSQNLTKITHHGQRASGIVRNMLQHSRTSTGQREPTDLNALADEYLRLSYHGLRAKDKHGSTVRFNSGFRAELDPALPPVPVVAQDIGRVLLNLFNNAFYAVQQRTEAASHRQAEPDYQPMVTLQTQRLDNQVKIMVRDNGTGMTAEVQQKIFQPFFTTKPAGSGTGLGLSLSYDIITKGHGGTLTVTSEAGSTEFCITLPLPVAPPPPAL